MGRSKDDWYDDEVEGDAPDDVVEVEHEAHEEEEEVPTEVSAEVSEGVEYIYDGKVCVYPGVATKRTAGKHIIDENGVRRRLVL